MSPLRHFFRQHRNFYNKFTSVLLQFDSLLCASTYVFFLFGVRSTSHPPRRRIVFWMLSPSSTHSRNGHFFHCHSEFNCFARRLNMEKYCCSGVGCGALYLHFLRWHVTVKWFEQTAEKASSHSLPQRDLLLQRGGLKVASTVTTAEKPFFFLFPFFFTFLNFSFFPPCWRIFSLFLFVGAFLVLSNFRFLKP